MLTIISIDSFLVYLQGMKCVLQCLWGRISICCPLWLNWKINPVLLFIIYIGSSHLLFFLTCELYWFSVSVCTIFVSNYYFIFIYCKLNYISKGLLCAHIKHNQLNVTCMGLFQEILTVCWTKSMSLQLCMCIVCVFFL